MPKTIRNQFNKNLTYEKLMEAHNKSKKGKGYRKELIKFNLKQEEYIMWLLEQLQTKKYKHGGYATFYVTEPKLRKIEKSRYIDRIVHRWLVDNFLEPAFVPQFVSTSFACLKNKGMHKACKYVQNTMKHCKRIWGEYYILKMDVAKYFDNIDKEILLKIIKRKIQDPQLLWLIEEILFAQPRPKGLEIRKLHVTNVCKYLFKRSRPIHKTYIKNKILLPISLDDSIVIVKTKQEAKQALHQIQKFLKENLKLELNKKTQIFKNKQGVNFCGYKINEYRLKIRDKGKRKLKKKVTKLKHKIKQGEITSKEAKKYLAGHMGYIQIADVKNLTDKLFYIEEQEN